MGNKLSKEAAFIKGLKIALRERGMKQRYIVKKMVKGR
ncbi:hypothetical protein T03_11473 [Trichinella britovi]|uniref:Uncharacterized protein n=1 Tax=Trichinella britovi TaxID=45882 RepID=A0A0V0YX16_TRIBR|nr:hypothetical protein T03_11473 [Trichinella britovi]